MCKWGCGRRRGKAADMGGDHIGRLMSKGQGALQEESMVEGGECRAPW